MLTEEQVWFETEAFSHLMSTKLDFLFRETPDPIILEVKERVVYDYFISYRHREAEEYAKRLSEELKASGYCVYFAGEIPALKSLDDQDLRAELKKRLHATSVLIIIGSNDAAGGDWVRWEMETFDENHWGRHAPLITDEIDNRVSFALPLHNLYHVSAVKLYEEVEGAWQRRHPSSLTILCLILVREFFRIEWDFWHNCEKIPADKRVIEYRRELLNDPVCNAVMFSMHFGDRDHSLQLLKNSELEKARKRREYSAFTKAVIDGFFLLGLFLRLPLDWIKSRTSRRS